MFIQLRENTSCSSALVLPEATAEVIGATVNEWGIRARGKIVFCRVSQPPGGHESGMASGHESGLRMTAAEGIVALP
jgi:hypothetical protein